MRLLFLCLETYVIITFVKSIISLKNRSSIVDSFIACKYRIVLLIISLVFIFNFRSELVLNKIPQGEYVINGVLSIDGVDYSVPIRVEKENDENEDRHGATVYLTYYFLREVTPPAKIMDNYEFKEFYGLPDTVESSSSYSIGVILLGVGDVEDDYSKKELDGVLSIPPLTKENLGVTANDQVKSFGKFNIIVEICILVMNIICLIAYISKYTEMYEKERRGYYTSE